MRKDLFVMGFDPLPECIALYNPPFERLKGLVTHYLEQTPTRMSDEVLLDHFLRLYKRDRWNIMCVGGVKGDLRLTIAWHTRHRIRKVIISTKEIPFLYWGLTQRESLRVADPILYDQWEKCKIQRLTKYLIKTFGDLALSVYTKLLLRGLSRTDYKIVRVERNALMLTDIGSSKAFAIVDVGDNILLCIFDKIYMSKLFGNKGVHQALSEMRLSSGFVVEGALLDEMVIISKGEKRIL